MTWIAQPPAAGDTAPELVLPTLDGEAFDLAEHGPVLVTFLRHAG